MRRRGEGRSRELRVAPESRGENEKVGFWANKGAALYEPFEGLLIYMVDVWEMESVTS